MSASSSSLPIEVTEGNPRKPPTDNNEGRAKVTIERLVIPYKETIQTWKVRIVW